jgi:DNA mismatch repair protein MutL
MVMTMSKIKVMSSSLANMIAAGEVVDQPSAVIKELVENSLDANASWIQVEVDASMTILVTDNGHGMSKEDVLLSVLRHATSKIIIENDLNHIHTLGFRGEALAAISAVSRVTIASKPQNEMAYEAHFEAGKLISETEPNMNVGTIVKVESLFYNTPARFKFLNHHEQEIKHIIETFEHLALSSPSVRMSLISDGKLLKQTTGSGDVKTVIFELFGSHYIDDMVTISTTIQHTHIKLWLASPFIHKSHKRHIWIVLNGRFIKNFRLSDAIVKGYEDVLMIKRYPVVYMSIDMDPSLTDVNVHPQKMQVKMASELLISFHLTTLIQSHFKSSTRQVPTPYKELEVYTPLKMVFEESDFEAQVQEAQMKKLPEVDYVGTFFGTYILFQNEQGLWMMDQHAAEERIRFEYYETKLTTLDPSVKKLLLPYPLKLHDEPLQLIQEKQSQVLSYGFQIENGHLEALPKNIRDEDIDLVVDLLVDALTQDQPFTLKEVYQSLAKDISCKGAIKANQRLSIKEAEVLYSRLKACDNPYHCPHGRPTIILIRDTDVEKMFQRIVS